MPMSADYSAITTCHPCSVYLSCPSSPSCLYVLDFPSCLFYHRSSCACCEILTSHHVGACASCAQPAPLSTPIIWWAWDTPSLLLGFLVSTSAWSALNHWINTSLVIDNNSTAVDFAVGSVLVGCYKILTRIKFNEPVALWPILLVSDHSHILNDTVLLLWLALTSNSYFSVF